MPDAPRLPKSSRVGLLYVLAAILVTTAILAITFWTLVAPGPPQKKDNPKAAAAAVSAEVARATDEGSKPPPVPSCEEALSNPAPDSCQDYGAALEDFLASASKPCPQGYPRAEDFSCVPASFFDDQDLTKTG